MSLVDNLKPLARCRGGLRQHRNNSVHEKDVTDRLNLGETKSGLVPPNSFSLANEGSLMSVWFEKYKFTSKDRPDFDDNGNYIPPVPSPIKPTPVAKHPFDYLNKRERGVLWNIYDKYKQAKDAKNYEVSDALRSELASRGCAPPEYDTWYFYLESQERRVERAASRYWFKEP